MPASLGPENRARATRRLNHQQGGRGASCCETHRAAYGIDCTRAATAILLSSCNGEVFGTSACTGTPTSPLNGNMQQKHNAQRKVDGSDSHAAAWAAPCHRVLRADALHGRHAPPNVGDDGDFHSELACCRKVEPRAYCPGPTSTDVSMMAKPGPGYTRPQSSRQDRLRPAGAATCRGQRNANFKLSGFQGEHDDVAAATAANHAVASDGTHMRVVRTSSRTTAGVQTWI